MPSTQNKGYTVPSTGSEAGTWGSDLNANFQGIVDNNLGGIVTKSVAGSNITLTSTESQNVVVRLTGVQSADVTVTNPCIGFYFVENLTTNAFAITMTNGVTGVVVPKGRSTVIADTTNGCRIAGTDSFPTGTRMSFQQTAAPTGWTKDTSNDNKAIRIVAGAVSSGGTLGFTTCFNATRSLTGSVANYTLQIADIPSHIHTWYTNSPGSANGGTGSAKIQQGSNPTGDNSFSTAPTGGGGPHAHTAGTLNAQMDVAYIDMIIAVKN